MAVCVHAIVLWREFMWNLLKCKSEIKANERKNKWIDNEQHTWKSNMLFLFVRRAFFSVGFTLNCRQSAHNYEPPMKMANLLAWESHSNCVQLSVSYFSWCRFINAAHEFAWQRNTSLIEWITRNAQHRLFCNNVPLITWSFSIS